MKAALFFLSLALLGLVVDEQRRPRGPLARPGAEARALAEPAGSGGGQPEQMVSARPPELQVVPLPSARARVRTSGPLPPSPSSLQAPAAGGAPSSTRAPARLRGSTPARRAPSARARQVDHPSARLLDRSRARPPIDPV